jgi:hypothetical protein
MFPWKALRYHLNVEYGGTLLDLSHLFQFMLQGLGLESSMSANWSLHPMLQLFNLFFKHKGNTGHCQKDNRSSSSSVSQQQLATIPSHKQQKRCMK